MVPWETRISKNFSKKPDDACHWLWGPKKKLHLKANTTPHKRHYVWQFPQNTINRPPRGPGGGKARQPKKTFGGGGKNMDFFKKGSVSNGGEGKPLG